MDLRIPERRPTVEDLNTMSSEEFVRAVGHAFEDSPWIAEQAWAARPFGSLEELHEAMCNVVDGAGPERQLALINAHPELAGRALESGGLSLSSRGEQHSLGLHRLDSAERERLLRLSAAYRERFGFLCIVCVREHSTVESILDTIANRLNGSGEAEIQANLQEIGKIARLRLKDALAREEERR